MTKLKRYAPYFIIIGLAMMLVAIGQLGGANAVWADGLRQGCGGGTIPDPSCLTPQPGGGGGDGATIARIVGAVTDLSTGKAGAGVIVRINNDEVTTDSFGDYSLAGAANGEYVVDLVLSGGAVPAQKPVIVFVNGVGDYIVNLEYYSVPPAGGVQLKTLDPVGAAPAMDEGSAETAETDNAAVGQDAQTASNDAASDSNSGQTDATASDASATSASTEQSVQSTSGDATSDSSSTQSSATAAQPESSPEALPQTGGQSVSSWWALLAAGIFLLLAGIKLSKLTGNKVPGK